MIQLFDAVSKADRSSTVGTVADETQTALRPMSESTEPSRSESLPAASANSTPPVAHDRQERRRQKRVGLKLGVRVRAADSRNATFDEVLVTINTSRDGLYFATRAKHYYPGMRLRITFPYTSPHDTVISPEDDGEVVRTIQLSDHRTGVAIRLRGPAQTATSTANPGPVPSRSATTERRLVNRYPFSAGALVVDSHSNTSMQGRCSDLSLEGCYIDTLNPFIEGTLVNIKLRNVDGVLDLTACVRSSHVGMGMGLAFSNLTPEQTSVLINWLNGTPGEKLPVASLPDTVPQPDVPDQVLAIGTVRELISKGLLTRSDIMTLLSE